MTQPNKNTQHALHAQCHHSCLPRSVTYCLTICTGLFGHDSRTWLLVQQQSTYMVRQTSATEPSQQEHSLNTATGLYNLLVHIGFSASISPPMTTNKQDIKACSEYTRGQRITLLTSDHNHTLNLKFRYAFQLHSFPDPTTLPADTPPPSPPQHATAASGWCCSFFCR